MAIMKVTSNGQISLPAAVRNRWKVKRVLISDEGDRLVILPMEHDPLDLLEGMFAGSGQRPSEDLRAEARAKDAATEERKWGPSEDA